MSGQREATEAGMRTLLAHCREEGVGSRELGARRVVAFPVLAAAVERVLDLCDEWASRCAPNEWPEGGMENAVIADAGRAVRAALLGES